MSNESDIGGLSPEEYGEKYRDHLMEQYKLYVEMADRISARRMKTNTFFLSINTGLVSAIAAFGKGLDLWAMIAICVGATVLCYVWMRVIKSYRQLNTAKYKVIGRLEKFLPTSPYWSLEWAELGEGKDPRKYTPLTALERWVPIVFILIYIYLTVVGGVIVKSHTSVKSMPKTETSVMTTK
ncbi:hypothetical protein KAR91_05880 [Candidatus Pacearchaeota archaeon]|nr:hypothetical protein [Candidatus Pacearchaeota archaeon]